MTIPTFDPRDTHFRIRPDFNALTAPLRAESPVHEVAPGLKVLSRYDDIREVSRSPERFRSGGGVLANDPIRDDGRAIAGSIIHMDPPTHGEWRRVRNRRFTPRAVGPMKGRIRELTGALLDELPRGEPTDLVEGLCAPLRLASRRLGKPESIPR